MKSYRFNQGPYAFHTVEDVAMEAGDEGLRYLEALQRNKIRIPALKKEVDAVLARESDRLIAATQHPFDLDE